MDGLNFFDGKIAFFVFGALVCMMPDAGYAKSKVAQTALERINVQHDIYPQEKLHVVTDRDIYFGGDTVWCRIFLVDAASHQQVNKSKYVYMDLLDPFGEVWDRFKIIEKDGVFTGYIPLDEDVFEGDYTLAAYTMYSENEGKDYFFRKPLRLIAPYSSKYAVDYEFTPIAPGEVKGTFKARSVDGGKMNYNIMSWTMADGKSREMPDSKNGFSRNFKREKGEDMVLVRFGDYRKYIPVEYPVETTEMKFYPEGGWLISGEPCRVAFKATDEGGKGVSASGVVRDDTTGENIAEFATTHDGMGFVEFVPEPGHSYSAEYSGPESTMRTAEIGTPNPGAAALRYDATDEKVYLSVAGGEGRDLELVLALRGTGILSSPISSDVPIYINSNELSSGLYNALLVSRADSAVLSERLFFIGADRTASKFSQISQDSLSLTLKAPERVAGDCAVRIVNGKIMSGKSDRDIRTRLLLESELRGRIENPAYYFSESPEAERNLDLVMMVNGWSRYNLPEAIKGQYEEPLVPLEIGQEISGQVRSRWKGKPMRNVLVYAMAPKRGFGTFAQTDAQGKFCLNGFDLPEGTSFIFRAMNERGGNEGNYELDAEEFPVIDILHEAPASSIGIEPADLLKNIRWIMLDEVKIQAFNNHSNNDFYGSMASVSKKAEDFEKKGITTLEQALRGIAGMTVRNGYLYFRNVKVTYLIDGTPYYVSTEIPSESGMVSRGYIAGTYARSRFASKSLANVNPYNTRMLLTGTTPLPNKGGTLIASIPTLAEVEMFVPFSNVDRMDFLRSNSGGGSTIVLSTKNGEGKTFQPQFELKDYLPLGYQKYKEYASPLLLADTDEYDLQTHPTLLWLPSVRFDSDGHAIDLKLPISSDYQILIEGITDNGDIISEEV